MACFQLLCGRREDSISQISELGAEFSGINNIKVYKYKELKVATNDFSRANKIGEGGFGSVYKGKLRDGRIAAIKVLSAGSWQGVQEFLAEINAISYVQHENLVELYGCCVEGDNRILVYNFMKNNSLARTLLGCGIYSHKLQFDWKTRSRLCIGVARGLSFLHYEVKPPIVHRDIKASNILVDKDLIPKISDFGLAKLFPDNVSHISTSVAGTIGYLAPEYARRGKLTRKADVYSFGVLVMEIVSGKCNTDSRLPIRERFLLDRAWNLFEKDELMTLVDQALDGDFDAEEACRFLKIGLLCTQENPKLRPSMPTVVQLLEGEMSFDLITKPGLISDIMDIKVHGTKDGTSMSKQDNKTEINNDDGNNNMSPSLESMEASAKSFHSSPR